MSTFPRPAAHVMPVSASLLQVRYGRRWAIAFSHVHMVWFAERRWPSGLHVLVAHQPHELAIRIEAAEKAGQADAARWVTSASGPDWRDDAGQDGAR